MSSRTTRLAKKAHLVALIGNDGAGKTTQADRLVRWLTRRRQTVVRFPNESLQPLKQALTAAARRRSLATPDVLLGRNTEQLMYAAVKWTAMMKARHLLTQPDCFVVTDRYSYCHIAALHSQALPGAAVLAELFEAFPEPDLAIYLDVEPATAIARMGRRGTDVDIPTREYLEAHANFYGRLPVAARFVVVDGNRPPIQVGAEIRRQMCRRFAWLAQ